MGCNVDATLEFMTAGILVEQKSSMTTRNRLASLQQPIARIVLIVMPQRVFVVITTQACFGN